MHWSPAAPDAEKLVAEVTTNGGKAVAIKSRINADRVPGPGLSVYAMTRPQLQT